MLDAAGVTRRTEPPRSIGRHERRMLGTRPLRQTTCRRHCSGRLNKRVFLPANAIIFVSPSLPHHVSILSPDRKRLRDGDAERSEPGFTDRCFRFSSSPLRSTLGGKGGGEVSAVVPATDRLLFPRARGSNTPSSRWRGDVGRRSRAGINGAGALHAGIRRVPHDLCLLTHL